MKVARSFKTPGPTHWRTVTSLKTGFQLHCDLNLRFLLPIRTHEKFVSVDHNTDRLCGLVVRVSGYRYRGPGFDPQCYQIFVVVGLERGPLSLVRSIEELLEWKSSGSRSRKQRLTAVGTRCADHVRPLYPQKLALTSPTGGGRSVGIVRVRTKATEFSLV